MNISEFREELLSGDLSRCMRAAAEATLVGEEAIDVAGALMTDRTLARNTRFWSLQSLGQFSKRHPTRIAALAVEALSDVDAGTQAVALQILEQLRPVGAVDAIASLLDSATRDPTDWNDDPRSIGRAAEEALRAIGGTKVSELLSARKAGA